MSAALAARLRDAAEWLAEEIPEGTAELSELEGDVRLDELDLYCVGLMRQAAKALDPTPAKNDAISPTEGRAGNLAGDEPPSSSPPQATNSEVERLTDLINRELRSFELNGGNILDAIATYHGDKTVKEALEIVGDWSAWLARALAQQGEKT